MRTPPMPGRYTPGSTVTTTPGARIAVDPGRHRGGLVDVEAHAVAGAVLEARRPSRPRRSPPGRPGRRPRPPPRGAPRPRPAAWDWRHHLEDPGQLAGRLAAHAEGPGHVRPVALEDAPRSRPPPGRPARWCGGPAGGGAWPSWGPTPRWSRRPCSSAPRCRMAVVEGRRRRRPRWSSRPPASGSTSARAASAMAAARAIRATSPSSLTSRSASTSPRVGTSSTPPPGARPTTAGRPGDVVGLQAQPWPPPRAADQGRPLGR